MKGSSTKALAKRLPTRGSALKGFIMATWIVAQGVLLNTAALATSPQQEPLKYSELLEKIDAGEVTRVEIDPAQRVARVRLEDQKPTDPMQEVRLFDQNPELTERLRANKVDFDIKPTTDNNVAMTIVGNLLLVFLLFGVLMLILRRSTNSPGGPGQAMNFGKSRARFQMEAKTGVMFDDVAGIEEAKEELQEVVTFLKKPERFTAVGARIPKAASQSDRRRSRSTLFQHFGFRICRNVCRGRCFPRPRLVQESEGECPLHHLH
jgi:cell division protease FtsH